MPKLSELMASHQPETTPLSPVEEVMFQQWAAKNGISDVDAPDSHYDYRGYWKEHGNAPIRFGVDHFTDTYKQHGHPVFSAESQYSRGKQDGGQWLPGDVLVAPPMASHGGMLSLADLLKLPRTR